MNTSHTMVDRTDGASPALDDRSLNLRKRMIEVFNWGRRGHLGSAFSLVEILRVLFDNVLRYDPQNPKWPERDRFVLSKGHGCIALYVFLAEKGFFPESELKKFCKSDGMLGGHPDHNIPGIEASTGSLGHGFSIGLGFAVHAKYYAGAGQRVFVVIGDGESNEGSIWEAAMCAGKHKLSNLTVIVDYNKNQSYSSTYEVQDLEPLAKKWESFGFAVTEVDGHSVEELQAAFQSLPLQEGKPSVVICHTVKGKGVRFIEGDMEWHHKSGISEEDIQSLLAALKEAN